MDGDANGIAAMKLLTQLQNKYNLCMLHQLQQAVLWALGMTGKQSKNPCMQKLIKAHHRMVAAALTSIALYNKLIEVQEEAQVQPKDIFTPVQTIDTSW